MAIRLNTSNQQTYYNLAAMYVAISAVLTDLFTDSSIALLSLLTFGLAHSNKCFWAQKKSLTAAGKCDWNQEERV